MTNYREILRLKSMGFNNRQISDSSGATRQTVIAVLQRAAACELDYRSAEALSDRELAKLLLQQSDSSKPKFVMPDYDWVNSELARPGVTLQLLWLEYCDKCISSGEIPYLLTQFKKYYREYAVQTKATMHLLRKPGELMEVDWAGQTAAIIDDTTGEVIDAYVFVAVLPYSGYGYVEAFLNQVSTPELN